MLAWWMALGRDGGMVNKWGGGLVVHGISVVVLVVSGLVFICPISST